jgi:antitoxin VapB
MALNIKNSEADRLARELADVTGLTITEAVMEAIEEKLQREKARRSSDRLLRDIGRIRERFAALPVLDARDPDDVIGYDEFGLPG